MKVSDKIIKPVTEAKYLNAENADRYRCIMRIFYENYEKLRYWMYQEDVYGELIQEEYFRDYRMEQCQQDLTALTEWKNLVTIQDTRKVSSIEEFKNKKFRYQMSEYSVEIERLVIRLENLFIEGASLEPTLLERICRNIQKIPGIAHADMNSAYTWWNDLNNDFIRLNQNYQDYIRELSSIKAEEMMRTKEFLVFKDKLIDYLRSFIKGLQKNVGLIEESITNTEKEHLLQIFQKVNEYECSIPRLDTEVSMELIAERTKGRWQSIYEWFVPKAGQENEAGKLFDSTNEIIRRITRYATQLSEKNALGANRREEYLKVASIFLECADMSQAHKMAAMVFGVERPAHLKGDFQRETESMNGEVFAEAPLDIQIKPRIRTYKEKTTRSSVNEYTKEKEMVRKRVMEEMVKDQQRVLSLEKDGKIDFANLPIIEPRVREILLKWISDAMENIDLSSRTEDGRDYYLKLDSKQGKCVVHCEDGVFTMPAMTLVFGKDTPE